ncbi:MAG: restriction endonuclease subunit S, partial [Gemmatimonadota bacterium]|nr:restriction endonuclease subunit S [Gemmatimonadota bacterium]
RQTILSLAVRGKLVEQDPADEPASELLKQIAGVRAQLGIKRGGRSPSADEPPFSLPVGWHWSRLGALCTKTGSGSTPRGGKSVYRKTGVPFLRSQNVYDDGLRLGDVAFVGADVHARMAGTSVAARDLLLNITGGSMGRCCRVPDHFAEANVSQHVAIIRPAVSEMADYLHKLVLSPYFQAFIFREQTGAGRGGLPKNRMDRIAVALPPLAEQHRIVAKVDALMALCDQLEAEIGDADGMRSRLLDSLLQESLASQEASTNGAVGGSARVRA